MPARIDQSAVVVLAVQFDQRRSQLAQQCGTDRLVVDEGLARPVRFERAAQDQRFAGLDLHVGFGEHLAHRRR